MSHNPLGFTGAVPEWFFLTCGALRFLLGLVLFCSGCLLTYRAELGRNRQEIAGFLLILLGLICGFWDRLWL